MQKNLQSKNIDASNITIEGVGPQNQSNAVLTASLKQLAAYSLQRRYKKDALEMQKKSSQVERRPIESLMYQTREGFYKSLEPASSHTM